MSEQQDFSGSADRRSSDRRRGETGTMEDTRSDIRSASPATSTADVPTGVEPIESQRTSRRIDYWPEMAQFRQRFDEIQAGFIEDPRAAVQKAEKLVDEAIERMTASMRESIRSMHRDAESGDTEKLRLTMRSLRDFIESIGGRRAA